MTRAALLFTRDLGSRVRAHPSASPQDRACALRAEPPSGVSGKAASHIARALRDPRSLAAFGFIFALAVLA